MNMKKLIAMLLALALALSLSACALAEDAVRVAALKGPTSMGLVQLLETAEGYDFTLAGTADEITPKLLQGELDIAALPVNAIATLYNKTEGKLQMAAINTLGVLYIVEKGGEEIARLEDLKGQTIYATGKGNTPEYVLTYLLAQHGLDIHTDLTVEWKAQPDEVVPLMKMADHAVAMLPQPYVTAAGLNVEGLRTALDLTAEWDALGSGSRLITAGIVVRRAFAEEHPEKVAAFLADYAASVAFANENVEEAAQLIEKYGIVAKAAIAQKALPACNIVCITGEDMAAAAGGYLQVLFDLNPASVGGALPGEDFYLMMDESK